MNHPKLCCLARAGLLGLSVTSVAGAGPIHDAARADDVHRVYWELKRGVGVDERDAGGATALIVAKQEGLDLALVFSEREAAAAGVFTRNALAAAPVHLCRDRVRRGKARAVIINSGNANACTGEAGDKDARAMSRRTAEALGLAGDDQILVASTGVIGHRLPMAKIESAIPAAVSALDEQGGDAAAKSILTTDLVPKTAAVEVELSGGSVRVGAMAKGSGMIRPRLVEPEGPASLPPPPAPMLAFVTTDASAEPADLQKTLSRAAEESFNCITVDGETSTNDTVLLLANGASGVGVSTPADLETFQEAIGAVCLKMAHAIVRDGEGATKFVTVRVSGAADGRQARTAAFAIADSNLVKTALFGCDPNWGRIVSAAGASGVEVRPEALRVKLNGAETFGGARADPEGAKPLDGPEVEIEIDLGVADGTATVWTSDLSYEYVRINAEYHT